ncbi:MAG: sulfite exporter TauE/SafE family protein [Candidatus Kryptonium sp.]|nr:sulfite exporter TauE/SafE family protein [Candidatus Kryptonium sp.]
MILWKVLLLFISGLFAGFLAGFFGIGGGVILVLILMYYYSGTGISPDLIPKIAVATSLFTIIFTSISSTVKQYENKNIEWNLTFTMGFASVVSALVGSKIATIVSGDFIRTFIIAVIILAGIRMLIDRNSGVDVDDLTNYKSNVSTISSIFWGLITGIISIFAGVGGGILLVPVMNSIMKIPIKRAIGTSSSIIVLTSIFGTLGYVINGFGKPELENLGTLGFVDYTAGIPILIGSILTSRLGAQASYKTRSKLLKKLFAALLITVAILTFFK